MSTLAVGNVVTLQSGGELMTVKEAGDVNAIAVYILNGEVKEISLPTACFKLVVDEAPQ